MTQTSFTVDGGVGVLRIDNAPVNALGQEVRAGLVDAIEQAETDPSVSVVLLCSAGKTFSAGADIREFSQPATAPFLPDVVHRLEACSKPVVAAIQGKALGGGLEIALGCHYRIASRRAAMGLPEVLLGLLPGAAGTQRLPRLVGPQKALDIMLGGAPLDAGAAKTIGLVDSVIDADDFDAAAIVHAREFADQPTRRISTLSVPEHDKNLFAETRQRVRGRSRGLLSPGKIIDCVRASVDLDYAAGCEFEREAFLECKASPQSAGLRHAFFAERQVGKVPGVGPDATPRPISRVAVIGAGTMGAGIAYAALSADLDVLLMDNDRDGLRRGCDTIDDYFAYGVDRGKFSSAIAAERRSRLRAISDYDDLRDADLVIEAVFESMAAKESVFSQLDRVCRDGAILATNTSTLDIDRIAAATRRPGDVIGLHFFSPAHVMRLLEIVRGDDTATDVVATALMFAKRLGKIGVVVGNCYGFVGNRMLYSYGRENQLMLLEGAAPERIDQALYDWGMAMGPNAVGDLAGLDVGYKARQAREDLPDDPRFYRVADLLVEQGRFGQKTGRGMYRYEAGSRTPQPDPEIHDLIATEAARLGIEQREFSNEEIVDRCILGLVTEGARLLEEGIALRASDIDVVWINGYGFPRHRGGPMHYADELGLDRILARVSEFAERFGSQYWEPPTLLRELAADGARFAEWRTR